MNWFETAVVNEPSVFEPLKFYCICNNTVGHVLYFAQYPDLSQTGAPAAQMIRR